MPLRRLPDEKQLLTGKRCPDPQHYAPSSVDRNVKPGSYMWSCPTCLEERRVEIGHPIEIGELRPEYFLE